WTSSQHERRCVNVICCCCCLCHAVTGKLSEALVMFETRMLKEEQLPPEEYNYTVLIGGCGRAGYLKKAIRLYNDMKKRAIIPSEATYTALFNACAESPWKHSGLQFVIKLREELKRKNIQANLHTYHSMLKAFAICSDLRACFQVLQEIVHSGHEVNEITFSNLMIGCINDTENGFRCLLQIWRQMLKLGIRPDAKSYNLLLRGARDCGIGEPSMASRLLLDEDDSVRSLQQRRKVRRLKGQKEKHKEKSTGSLDVDLLEQQIFADVPLLPEDGDKARGAGPTARINPESTWKPVKAPEPLDGPLNLLDLQVHKGNVISLGAAGRPCDRLALIGNLSGLLGKMKADGVRPDIKTFTLLVDVMDLENDSESSLLTLMDEHGVKADISFFNTLVRKRSKMGDLEGAKAVIRLLTERSLTPNMYTFCNLAIACRKSCDGLQLLSDMKMSGVIPNVNVYSTLINAAAKQLDYVFLIDVLRDMARNQVSPNQVVLRQLEFAASYPPKFDRYKSKNTYLEKIDGFRGFYYQWLTWMPVAETPHPWERYRIKKVSSTQEDQPNQSDVKTTTTKLRPEKKKKSKVH
uniref:Pentatricopeptide repeat domain 1 n=1 Tax=Callorhinchus milii TaxID=7868 RepID=A0A4W3JJ84_CALMI